MRNGHRIIDSDGHAMEPWDLWDKHIDKAFYDDRPRCDPDTTDVVVLGHVMSRSTQPTPGYDLEPYKKAIQQGWPERFAEQRARGFSADSYVDAMDAEGVDVMVLFPTRGLYAASVEHLPGALSAAICRAYNRWVADFTSYSSRLAGVALMALHDPGLAAKEARYAVEELGLKALMVRPNPYEGRTLDHRANDVFWAEAASLGVPVATHEGAGVWMPEYGFERFSSRLAQHAICHSFEQMAAVVSFTTGGILERHPDLKVAILESGGGWLPYWLSRLDDHAEWLHDVPTETGELRMKPSEYFKRQGFINFEVDEPGLEALAAYLGPDRMLWASDYPHPDAKYPGMVDHLFDAKGLTPTDVRSVADAAPSALYGF